MTENFLPPLPPLPPSSPPNQQFSATGQQKTGIASGPFGLAKGLRKEDLPGQLQEIKPCFFQTDKLPKTHSASTHYFVQITPVQGLSWVKSIGNTIQTNPYGIELRTAFEDMRGKLEKIYGKSESIDYLMYESIWNEPRDWMQAIQNGERKLAAIWENKGNTKLPSSLENVFLYVAANDAYSGWIAIEYTFDNYPASEQELAMLEDDAL